MEAVESHEAVVDYYYRYVDAGNVDALVALFDEEVVYERPGYEPIIGRAALSSFYRDVRIIESGRHELLSVVAGGNRVAVEGKFAGRLKDGTQVRLRFADFFSFREGGIVKRSTYFFRPAV